MLDRVNSSFASAKSDRDPARSGDDSVSGNALGLQPAAASAAKFLGSEFLAVSAVAYLTSELYHRYVVPDAKVAAPYWVAALLLAALYCATTVWFKDLLHLQSLRHRRLLWNGVRGAVLAFAFLVSGMFLLKVSDEYSRGAFLAQFLAVCLTVLGLRSVMIGHRQRALDSGLLVMRRAFLIGEPNETRSFSTRLRASGIAPVSQMSFSSLSSLQSEATDGARKSLIEACRAYAPDDIFILPQADELESIKPIVDHLSQLPAAVHVLIPGMDELLSASEVLEFGNVATLQVVGRPLSALDEILKRSIDIVLASFLLVFFSSVMLISALLIKLTSRGPVLFRQARHGYNNQSIKVLKFRTMKVAVQDGEFRQATRNDHRVTWIGGKLRASSIDELPQLFNVLNGEMSIVGPRPHAVEHNRMFEERIPPLSRRHNVKPGITGWAQVNLLRGETDTLEKMQKRIDYDLFYIDNWSLYFDLKILVLTALLCLSPKNYRETY